MPTVSVHIVTYNSAATFDACLSAALSQKGVDFGIHVWDNASTDATLEIAARHGVAVTASRQNIGYAAAHNCLIDSTQSDYVLTLNPDARLLPGFLLAMAERLDEGARIGSAAGSLLRVEALGDNATSIDSTGLIMQRNRRQGLANEGQSVDLLSKLSNDGFAREIFGVDGACAFYRRAMLEDIRIPHPAPAAVRGGEQRGEIFDEDFFMHKEDVDVAWRARLRGWAAVYLPRAVAHHVRAFRPGQRARVSAYMRFLGTRNRYWLMLKNEIEAGFWHDLPMIAAYDAGIVAYLLAREWRSLPALTAAWRGRARMLEKRRLIQAARRVEWAEMRRWFRGR
ncbi:MAG: glycosyltransferase family 2 protein [Chloroflexota bacterium]|nr:glycosyltransferase family 2 protein [Chloroflexota bacterium]